jgi:hypothetical protein
MDYPETGKYYPLVIANNTVSIRAGITLDQVYEQKLRPFLYPLSSLTEPIIHEGKEEIPLVELAKIEGCYTNEDYEILVDEKGQWVCLKFEDGECVLNHFCYYPKLHSFSLSHDEWNDWHEQIVKDQLLLFDYLYSRRINIWGIEAIDPRTLEVNPYKI